MANEQAKQKLLLLAAKVQGRPITLTEDIRLDRALDAKKPASREGIEQVLAEGLQKSANEVGRTLASADDSDRIIDEIVKALGK
jgi:hypothetical protein